MRKILAKRIPAPICAVIILAIMATIIYAWTGGVTSYIEITNITNAGNLYLPQTVQGYIYNLDMPLYSYVIQNRLYQVDAAWTSMVEVPLMGMNFDTEAAISPRDFLTTDWFTVGLEYQVRIYAVTYDTAYYPDPSIVNLTEDTTGLSGWEAGENVVTFTVIEGTRPF